MSRAIFNCLVNFVYRIAAMLKMVSLPLLLLSVMFTEVLAGSVEQTHGDETLTTLLTRARELVEKSMTIWWLPPPLVSVIFIISMHVWVYGIVHMAWYFTSLLTSRIHANKT